MVTKLQPSESKESKDNIIVCTFCASRLFRAYIDDGNNDIRLYCSQCGRESKSHTTAKNIHSSKSSK